MPINISGHLVRIVPLAGARCLSLCFLLLQNFLVVRFLTVEDIGHYYLLTTLSYLGNAAFFSGFDLYLQRQLGLLSIDPKFSRRAFRRYLFFSSTCGMGSVLLIASMYFLITKNIHWFEYSVLCALLSCATYLSALARNLLQLAGRLIASSLAPVLEGSIRGAALLVVVYVGTASSSIVVVLSLLASSIAALVSFTVLLRHTRDDDSQSFGNFKDVAKTILPVGGTGVLNWVQLQGYRLQQGSQPALASTIGTVSFMSTLGGSAANAAFSILNQLQIPRQYVSQGKSTPKYLTMVFLISVLLAALSVPTGAFFLQITGRMSLDHLLYLVPLGVALEAGNTAISVCINHLNVRRQRLWQLPFCGIIGAALTYLVLMLPFFREDAYLRICLALLLGQLAVVIGVLSSTYLMSRDAPICLAPG